MCKAKLANETNTIIGGDIRTLFILTSPSQIAVAEIAEIQGDSNHPLPHQFQVQFCPAIQVRIGTYGCFHR